MADEIISSNKHQKLITDERFVAYDIAGIDVVKCDSCSQTESNAGRITCSHCGRSLEHAYVLVGTLGETAYFVKKSEMTHVKQ